MSGIVRATAVPFGAVGFDCLLAAALSGNGSMLARAILYMGIATVFLWASDRL